MTNPALAELLNRALVEKGHLNATQMVRSQIYGSGLVRKMILEEAQMLDDELREIVAKVFDERA